MAFVCDVPCYHPVKGFRGIDGGISWSPRRSYVDLEVQVPCGQCVGCKLERSRQWAVRCMHEASLHLDNSYLTLTYDDAHLPYHGVLQVRDFQLFMKRVRRAFSTRRIGVFYCGEYGEKDWRPHFHACLFGLDFPDRVVCGTNERGDNLYSSAVLSEFWDAGFAVIGDVTFESAGYVARYCLKKITGDKAEAWYRRFDPGTGEIYSLPPEFAHMSLRPGIGKRWFEKFGSELEDDDTVVSRGVEVSVPRYYDKLRDKSRMVAVKKQRVFGAYDRRKDLTPDRLKVREKVKLAQVNFLKRKL